MPSPDGVIIFTFIFGIITVTATCNDWEWYWNWAGRYLEDKIGYANRRKLHFLIGLIYIAISLATLSNNYLSANVVLAGVLGIIFASIISKSIYDLSDANLSVHEKSKPTNSERSD